MKKFQPFLYNFLPIHFCRTLQKLNSATLALSSLVYFVYCTLEVDKNLANLNCSIYGVTRHKLQAILKSPCVVLLVLSLVSTKMTKISLIYDFVAAFTCLYMS